MVKLWLDLSTSAAPAVQPAAAGTTGLQLQTSYDCWVWAKYSVTSLQRSLDSVEILCFRSSRKFLRKKSVIKHQDQVFNLHLFPLKPAVCFRKCVGGKHLCKLLLDLVCAKAENNVFNVIHWNHLFL